MIESFRRLDRLLRGDATRLADLESGRIEISVRSIALVVVGLAAVYGVCVGAYSLTITDPSGSAKDYRAFDTYMQVIASAVKMPFLFLLTVLVTLPSLYVYNALVGSRLQFISVVRLLTASIAVLVTVGASQGPIVVFFALSTRSYPFMLFLNVVSLTVAGFLGLAFLYRTLNRLVLTQEARDFEKSIHALDAGVEGDDPQGDDEGKESLPVSRKHARGPLDRAGLATQHSTTLVFRIWLVVFAIVGAQMSWILRPFVGSPDLAFSWFRSKESNFFEALVGIIGKLFQ